MKNKRFYLWVLFLVYLCANIFVRLNHRELCIGWENDWLDYAKRAKDFGSVFSFDGYRTFAYPFLIKIFSILTGDIILAGEFVVALAGMLMLIGVFRLALLLFSPKTAFYLTLLFVLNWFFVNHTILLAGTDILFAAFVIWGISETLILIKNGKNSNAIFAGLFFGLSYISRYTGLLFPIISVIYYLVISAFMKKKLVVYLRPLLLFLLAFFIVIVPQMLINFHGSGNPFGNYHIKNIFAGLSGIYYTQIQLPDAISISDIFSLGISNILKHIVKEFVKSCGRIFFMSFGADIKHSRYFAPSTAKVALLILFGILIFYSLRYCRFNFRKIWARNKAFLLFVGLLFFLYTLMISAIWGEYRFFIFILPLVYIILFSAIEFKKAGAVKLVYSLLLAILILNLITNTYAFKKANSFPVEKVISSFEKDGDVLVYGPYIHLGWYTKRNVRNITKNKDFSEILDEFSAPCYKYLVVVKNHPFTWEHPTIYPDELSNLGQYGFRLAFKLERPRQLYVWEKSEWEGQ